MMKQLVEKWGKKKCIMIGIIALLVIVATVLAIVFFVNRNEPKTVSVKSDAGYTKLIENESIKYGDVEKALKDFQKSEEGSYTVFTKGNESVKVKSDAAGAVTYIAYNNALGDDEQVKLKGFNESMIHIGDKEEDVLKLLAKYDFIYHLKSTNKNGQALHIYYYGWTSSEAALELVFIDGELTYYTINADELAAKSDAPDLRDIQQ
ncbi:MAG: hypothetical protein IJG23_06935 [Clostridia bacterium]|nr:hypothetical protein [Clostridia bacterium]